MTTVAQQLEDENRRFMRRLEGMERDTDPLSKVSPLPANLIGGRHTWFTHAPKTINDPDANWCVWRVWGDKRTQRKVFRPFLDEPTARDLASWCRDQCPDQEVGQGVNYLPGTMRGPAPLLVA